MKNFCFITLALFGVVPSAVFAAPSFDCKKASNEMEHAICKNSELSSLDQRLAELYKTALYAIPKELRQDFQSEQKSWLKDLQSQCSTLKEPTLSEKLQSLYSARIDELTGIGPNKIGPYLLLKKKSYVNKELTKEWPRFLGSSPSIKEINAIVNTNIDSCSGNPAFGDADLSVVKVETASNTVLQFERTCSYSGGAHPLNLIKSVAYSVASHRVLDLKDLFKANTKWGDKLSKTCFTNLILPGDERIKGNKVGIHPADSEIWYVKSDGLWFHFQIGMDIAMCKVPFKDLKSAFIDGFSKQFPEINLN